MARDARTCLNSYVIRPRGRPTPIYGRSFYAMFLLRNRFVKHNRCSKRTSGRLHACDLELSSRVVVQWYACALETWVIFRVVSPQSYLRQR